MCLSFVPGLSQIYFRFFPGLFRFCHRLVSGLYQVCISFVSGLSQVCLRFISQFCHSFMERQNHQIRAQTHPTRSAPPESWWALILCESAALSSSSCLSRLVKFSLAWGAWSSLLQWMCETKMGGTIAARSCGALPARRCLLTLVLLLSKPLSGWKWSRTWL